MEDMVFVYFIILPAFLMVLFAWLLLRFEYKLSRKLRCAKKRLMRTKGWREYVYWKREIRYIYWSFIPGLNPERIRSITSEFYCGKYAKKKEHNDGLLSMLAPSVIGIAICSVCLVGSTFAWFSASVSTPTQALQAANYSIEVSIQCGEDTISAGADGSYTLETNMEYSVTILAKGSASTGYCKINENIHTVQLAPDQTITFTLCPDTEKYVLVGVWGTSAKEESEKVDNKSQVGSPVSQINDDGTEMPEEPIASSNGEETETTTPSETTETTSSDTYTVVSGDTFSGIAEQFGTTVEKLRAYNDIMETDSIKAGDVLKIPPADYEVPKTESEDTQAAPATETVATPTAESETSTTPEETDNDEITNPTEETPMCR